MGIYERLGIRTIINARGSQTMIGGSRMPQEVLDAMAEASRAFVDITELNRKVGEIIARVTGAEAGYVTAGSAAGILLATAAVLTGKDPAKVRRIPDTTGFPRNEIVVQRSQRHGYDRMVWAAGGKIVEIGNAYMTQPWELEAAITERTAGVFYTISPILTKGFLPLPDVIRIAHDCGVPVYVDSASMLPPAENLTKWIGMGADLVIFSGGKGIRGPQDSGILAGRRDLIEAAAMSGNPFDGIGRAAKVSREAMAGLTVALEMYVRRDHEADQRRWRTMCEQIKQTVDEMDFSGVETSVVFDEDLSQLPELYVTLREETAGIGVTKMLAELYEGEPRVATSQFPPNARTIVFNPQMLEDGEEEIIARRLCEILQRVQVPAAAR